MNDETDQPTPEEIEAAQAEFERLRDAIMAARRRLGIQDGEDGEFSIEPGLEALGIDPRGFGIMLAQTVHEIQAYGIQSLLGAIVSGDQKQMEIASKGGPMVAIVNGLCLGVQLEHERTSLIAERLRAWLAELDPEGESAGVAVARRELAQIMDGENGEGSALARDVGFPGDSPDARIYRREAIEHKRQADVLHDVVAMAAAGATEADDLERLAAEALEKAKPRWEEGG